MDHRSVRAVAVPATQQVTGHQPGKKAIVTGVVHDNRLCRLNGNRITALRHNHIGFAAARAQQKKASDNTTSGVQDFFIHGFIFKVMASDRVPDTEIKKATIW